MLLAEDLKKAVLQAAIQGKLVEQRPEEETGEKLYQQLQEEKQRLIKNGVLRKTRELPTIKDEEIPFDFPETWKVCYIDDIAFVTKLAGFEYTKYIADNLVNEGIPLFKGKNVKNGEIIKNFESHIPENISDELPRSQITKKCLLTPYVGTIGNIAIFDGSFKAHLGSNVGKIELLNPQEKTLITEEYLLLYLKSQYGYNELIKYKKSTAQESISIDAIRNVIIAIPPLEEQRRIVDKIESVMYEIDAYSETEQELEILQQSFPDDFRKSVLQYAMQGKLVEQRKEEGTGEELYQQIQEEKARLIEEGKIKKEKPLAEITDGEIPFDIPDSWKWVRLNDIAYKTIKRGKSPVYTTKNDEILVFAQKCNVKNAGINLKLSKHLDKNHFTKYSPEEYMKDKDIVINSTGVGTLGRIGFYRKTDNPQDKIVVADSHVTIVRLGDSITSEYVYYILLNYQKYLERKGEGSTKQKELKPDTIKELLIPFPPLGEQKRIVTKINMLKPLVKGLKEAI